MMRHRLLVPVLVWALSRAFLSVLVWGGLVLEEPLSGEGTWRAFPENRFLDGWARWDSAWYAEIAEEGYIDPGEIVQGAQRNTHFFPLYPLLMRALTPLTGNVYLSGFLISNACFLVALILLYSFTLEKFDRQVAFRTLLLVALNPYSFFFSAIYTESLFLVLVVGSFYLAEKDRWLAASLLAGLASVTRIVGFVTPVALCVMYARRRNWKLVPWRWETLALAAGFVIPLLHLVFLHWRYGSPLEFLDAHQVEGWEETHYWPRTSAGQKHWLFILLAFGFSILAVKGIGLEYGLWGAATTLSFVTAWTGGGRYAMVVFPATMMLAKVLRNRYLFGAVLIFYGYYLIDYALRFSHWRFVA